MTGVGKYTKCEVNVNIDENVGWCVEIGWWLSLWMCLWKSRYVKVEVCVKVDDSVGWVFVRGVGAGFDIGLIFMLNVMSDLNMAYLIVITIATDIITNIFWKIDVKILRFTLSNADVIQFGR